MNQTELLQLMIVNAVKDGVKQALDEALKPIKEELLKVKALNVKLLKEGVSVQVAGNETSTQPIFKTIPRPKQEVLAEASRDSESLQSLKAQAAPFVSSDGMLPDVDIDPGLFLKRPR